MSDKDTEREEFEDIFDADDPVDMEEFMNMLDSIDLDDGPLVQEMEDTDTFQLEQTLADSDNPFKMKEDFYKLTEEEEKESAKKIDGMMSELGLEDAQDIESDLPILEEEPQQPAEEPPQPIEEPPQPIEEPPQPAEDTSAFVEPDEDIMTLLDSVGVEEQIPTADIEEEDVADESVGELAGILAGLEEEESQPDDMQEESVPKKSLIQRIKEKLHKTPTEEELAQRAQEEEEERAWEEKQKEAADAKKAEADEQKKQKKEEAARKKQEKIDKKEAQKAAKQEQKNAKKAEKEAKRSSDIPRSQLVPVKPLVVLIVLGIALSTVFVLFTNQRYYNSNISDAKEFFIHQQYKKAYELLLGLDVKKKDETFYTQVKTVRTVDKDLEAYHGFVKAKDYEMALKSLIRGIGRYHQQAEKAKELKLEKEMYSIYEEMLKELTVRFELTAQDAMNLYESNDKEAYEKQIVQTARDAAIRDGVLEPVTVTDMAEEQ